MSITSVLRPYFLRREKMLARYDQEGEELQREVLQRLVRKAHDTSWGKAHHYDSIKTYEDFAKETPLTSYEELKGFIDEMRHGKENVLWPGRVRWYAKSSGTTNDKSKFIPVSPDGLKHIHYKGGQDAVAIYLKNHPESRLFDGKALILGGSHAPNYNLPHSLVGDLSAILIENINPLANMVRVPRKSTALLSDFEEKRTRIALEAIKQNVSNISGVPSWMLSVINRVLELSGKNYLDEVWPNLEVFFHGGVAFTPYREQYKELIRSEKMHYMETYNASEGFFGLQDDPLSSSLLLMLDYDVFYEFIPLEEVGRPAPSVVPLWGVEKDRNYALVITTSCGLWRYQIGDTVRFTDVNPYKFIISGRTKSFINAFGEELMVDNAEKGLAAACQATGAVISDYTAAPVFMDKSGKCRHEWLVEFTKEPEDMDLFAHTLDKALQDINSDYEAKRHKDITLREPLITKARAGLFTDWLASKGKLGGQHKVPRLANNRDIIDDVLSLSAKE